MEIGYGTDSTIIALSYPIFVVIASFTIVPLLATVSKNIKCVSIITPVLLIMEFICLVCLLSLNNGSQDFKFYLLLLSLGSYFMFFPYSRVASNEFTERTEN